VLAKKVAHAAAVQQAAATVPIVLLGVNDPVAAGLVASLARPGGTATGFTAMDFGTAAKWLELLKQIAPGVNGIGVLRPANIGGVGQLGAIQGAASSLGVLSMRQFRFLAGGAGQCSTRARWLNYTRFAVVHAHARRPPASKQEIAH
jgi:hypothetical protein